jgi:polygalacturonase
MRQRNPSLHVLLAALLLPPSLLLSQDTRTVTEPTFPPTCATLGAQLTIAAEDPSSETAFDTARIQAALKACPSGKAVELVASGSDNAFLIQQISIPTGVTLLIDAGVTVFGSRNPADYQIGTVSNTQEACGTVGTLGNGCGPLIKSKNTTGSGIMGYGIIDGRGQDNLIVNGVTQSFSWYSNTLQAYATNVGGMQNNPILISPEGANNFTLYKITLRNSPYFNVHWAGEDTSATMTTGLTVWGVKIIEPYAIHNTDGVDPVNNASDVTITNSFISTGDDHIAVSSTVPGKPVTNVSITNVHTYSGHGISIGSWTQGGIGNVLVDTIDQAGNAADGEGNGLRIKSANNRGGLVQNVTFQNVCQRDETHAIRFDPFFVTPASTNTTSIPTFSNIAVRNVTILANSKGGAGGFSFQGYDANHITSLTLDNLNVLGTPDVTSYKPQYVAITLGPGPVNPVLFQQLTGAGVTYTGSVTKPSEVPYPCSAANFPTLVGELFLSTTGGTNLRTLSTAYPATFTLNAVVEATAAEYLAPTSPITFYEGANALGAATLGANGTLASLTLSGVSAGSHRYTAQYPADSNHSALAFGSVTVTVHAASKPRRRP